MTDEEELRIKMSFSCYNYRWSSFEESNAKINAWLESVENKLGDLKLWSTLDEKKNQLVEYKDLNYEINSNKKNLLELEERLESLPNVSDNLNADLKVMKERHETIAKRSLEYVGAYESIVNDHIKFDEADSIARDWLKTANSNVSSWSNSSLDRTSLHTNLDKLKVG